ncbi:MAG TPA: hypothetical protein VMT16_17275 [Thermoanaerobaculia bacterium]|nr:hypothetical protein [Thermoanaerobaculia bacterium]
MIDDPAASPGEPFEVWVNQPFHLSGEGEQYRIGGFATCAAACDACRRVIEEFLESHAGPLADAKALFAAWGDSGPEPWVKVCGGGECPFSAATYARQRCDAIYAEGAPPPAAAGQPPHTPA